MILGTNPGPTTLAYCMAKSALEQFNRCLAVGNSNFTNLTYAE
jgi:NAD(P)-dependent dehydrogenase (short-subunit alcohol dehydrogenase family)